MSEQFYSDARLYDLLFPGGEQAVDFYRAEAARQGGSVLELGSGTGHKLIPIASDGHPCTGLELSPDMLAEARRKADERGVDVEWVQGDMRKFDLGRTFDLVFIAANSLLHLHEADDLVDCFRSVRKHLAPGARLVFDVFNPSVHVLAQADGVRRRRHALSFVDPDRGVVQVDVAETYDATAQVTRGTWYFSTDSEADFLPRRWRSGASSPRSCRCSSRSAVCGSSNGTATGPERHSPQTRRSSSLSANRTEARAGRTVDPGRPTLAQRT